jgi:hypothetical protein
MILDTPTHRTGERPHHACLAPAGLGSAGGAPAATSRLRAFLMVAAVVAP